MRHSCSTHKLLYHNSTPPYTQARQADFRSWSLYRRTRCLDSIASLHHLSSIHEIIGWRRCHYDYNWYACNNRMPSILSDDVHHPIRFHYACVCRRDPLLPTKNPFQKQTNQAQAQIKISYRTSAKKQLRRVKSQAAKDQRLSKEHQYRRWDITSPCKSITRSDVSIQILERDKSSQEKAPQILKEELHATAPKGSRQFSTSARRVEKQIITYEIGDGLYRTADTFVEPSGHLFELPQLPLPRDAMLKHRYDPIIKQFTNLMMRDGKLSVAQRVRQSVSLSLTFNWS